MESPCLGGRCRYCRPPLSAVERGGVAVSRRLDPEERGGVEFPSYAGLMLDAGFRIGELPSALPEGASVFRDAYGRTCRVRNREVFAYSAEGPAFRFGDAELSGWLRKRCPGVFVAF